MRSRLQQRFDMGRTIQYKTLLQVFMMTFKREGIYGLYKGLVPNVLRTMPQSAIMFMVYEDILKFLVKFF